MNLGPVHICVISDTCRLVQLNVRGVFFGFCFSLSLKKALLHPRGWNLACWESGCCNRGDGAAVSLEWCCSFKSLTETSGADVCGTQSCIILGWNDTPSLIYVFKSYPVSEVSYHTSDYTVHPFLQPYFHSIDCEVHRENHTIHFEKRKKKTCKYHIKKRDLLKLYCTF